MPITPEAQRRQIITAQPQPPKLATRQKIKENIELLRSASGASSIQGFGRMAIGAIVLSMIFSLATLLAILYPYFAENIPTIAIYFYPLLVGIIIFLFYVAINYIREGFVMFEQSKNKEDESLTEFVSKIVE